MTATVPPILHPPLYLLLYTRQCTCTLHLKEQVDLHLTSTVPFIVHLSLYLLFYTCHCTSYCTPATVPVHYSIHLFQEVIAIGSQDTGAGDLNEQVYLCLCIYICIQQFLYLYLYLRHLPLYL